MEVDELMTIIGTSGRVGLSGLCAVIFVLAMAAEGQTPRKINQYAIDGVYEFVSQRSVLAKPENVDIIDSSPNWRGLWIFRYPYFSSTLMQTRRVRYFEESENREIGYESFAGEFSVTAKSVNLVQRFSLNPLFEGRIVVLSFQRRGNILTLTQRLLPYIEDGREGQLTLVLRKIS